MNCGKIQKQPPEIFYKERQDCQVSRIPVETPTFSRKMLSLSHMQTFLEISRILAFVTIFLA